MYVPAFIPEGERDKVRSADKSPPPERPVPVIMLRVLSALTDRAVARVSVSENPARNASSSFHLLIVESVSDPVRKVSRVLAISVTLRYPSVVGRPVPFRALRFVCTKFSVAYPARAVSRCDLSIC